MEREGFILSDLVEARSTAFILAAFYRRPESLSMSGAVQIECGGISFGLGWMPPARRKRNERVPSYWIACVKRIICNVAQHDFFYTNRQPVRNIFTAMFFQRGKDVS